MHIPFSNTTVSCQVCGHTQYFLGNHVAEAHGLTAKEYLLAHPDAPMASGFLLDKVRESQEGIRRSHPPRDVAVAIKGYVVPVNNDVEELDCLPLPEAYQFPEHGELSVDIAEALISVLRGRHTYIYGMPGTGKDALIHAVSNLTRRPTIMRQVDPNTDIESWLYTRDFNKDGTSWTEGSLLVALREGYKTQTGRRIPYTILLTDIDRANKSQAEFLRMVLDSTCGRVRGPGGTLHKVFPGTQFVATANTAGGGDPRGRMISANVIDGSILDRFERTYEFHWMDWRDEGPVCKTKFPSLAQQCPEMFDQVGLATASIRKAILTDTLYTEFSHRAVCVWLGHAQDIVEMVGMVPKDLPSRAARAWLDRMPDPETRLQAARLIDPFIKGGVFERCSDSNNEPLGGF